MRLARGSLTSARAKRYSTKKEDTIAEEAVPCPQRNSIAIQRPYGTPSSTFAPIPGLSRSTTCRGTPGNAGEREIRLIEVNRLMGDRTDDMLEPIDFGVDAGTETAHKLLVLDVTPEQWKRISTRRLRLPPGWTLDGAELIPEQSEAVQPLARAVQ